MAFGVPAQQIFPRCGSGGLDGVTPFVAQGLHDTDQAPWHGGIIKIVEGIVRVVKLLVKDDTHRATSTP
jgi:hypothetical protein